MTRRPLPAAARTAALALAAGLAACPLPQPLPEYPDTGTIPPPRILMDQVAPADAVVHVRDDCSPDPVYVLSASIADDDTAEAVGYRWFLDYQPVEPDCFFLPQSGTIQPPADGVTRIRAVPPLSFNAYGGLAHAAGDLHTVELVVSNGFVADVPPGSCLYRTPQPNFETQTYRWVFQYAGAADPEYAAATCGFPAPSP